MEQFVPVVRYLFSTVLGYAIVAGAVILKVPQILKIVRSGSAEGVSLTSNLLEMVGYTIATSWAIVQQLEFKDFGENVFVLVQLVALATLVGYHQKSLMYAVSAVVVIAAALYGLSTGALERSVHQSLLGSQILLLVSSRVPQIYLNYRNRSTGQLAFLTFFLAFGGGCARVVTTTLNVPWEKGKATILLQFGSAVLLNGIILAQIWIYRNASASQPKPKKDLDAKKKK